MQYVDYFPWACFSHKLISTTEGNKPESFRRDGRCEIRHAKRWLIIDQDVDEDRRLLASCHLGIPVAGLGRSCLAR